MSYRAHKCHYRRTLWGVWGLTGDAFFRYSCVACGRLAADLPTKVVSE